MVDPRRLESEPVLDSRDAADRDSRAETLLVDGLDRYFNGRYEDAIHLWTRVLFLDRSHARARAYIDRARTALAERQRRAEEMLQASRDLLEQGQTAAARDLLTEVVAESGDDEQVSALRLRLERVERVHATVQPLADLASAPPTPAPVEAVPGWLWPKRSRVVMAIGAGAMVCVLLALTLSSAGVQEWLGLRSASEGLRPAAGVPPLQVLSGGEVALVRARTLLDRGRLAEALQALDRVSPDSAQRPAADRLRADIQQLLLAGPR